MISPEVITNPTANHDQDMKYSWAFLCSRVASIIIIMAKIRWDFPTEIMDMR